MSKAAKTTSLSLLLLVVGAVAAYFLCGHEIAAVREQLIGFPNSDLRAHQLRPWLLGTLCLIPFLSHLLYLSLSILDRYTVKQFLTALAICFGAFYVVMFLEDFQDNFPDFKENPDKYRLLAIHYLNKIPAITLFILPYSLMLALLWSLGKMSKNQEIVSMIQTGRSVPRIIAPLVGIGLLSAGICLIFNYYWAPQSDAKESTILRVASGSRGSEARNVAFQDHTDTRHWFVGSFPYQHSAGEPLRDISITVMDSSHRPTQRIIADTARWNHQTKQWTLEAPLTYHLQDQPIPTITQSDTDLITEWSETPYQIIKPGLKAPYLGIPGLRSWLANHRETPLSDQRAYLTQLHYRYAQPLICLIIVLLAAPLGIVFTRRSTAGGVAVAIFLCAGMIFTSTIFPTLGESGHLSPIIAAWATNILFGTVAIILFYRRITGLPVYQSLKRLFSPLNTR